MVFSRGRYFIESRYMSISSILLTLNAAESRGAVAVLTSVRAMASSIIVATVAVVSGASGFSPTLADSKYIACAFAAEYAGKRAAMPSMNALIVIVLVCWRCIVCKLPSIGV